MTRSELLALLPLAIPAVTGTLVMLVGAFRERSRLHPVLAVVGMLTASASTLALWPDLPVRISGILQVDAFSAFFLVVLYLAVTGVALLAPAYLAVRQRDADSFWVLLLFAATGMGVLACSVHFVSLLLGLEILSVSLYALIGYLRSQRTSLEAAIKYLVLAALSSGILVFGIALLYAATGTLELEPAAARLAEMAIEGADSGAGAEASWAVASAFLLLVGFAFKLSLVPFHMWAPDVYEGAPAPVTALIATGSKGAILALLLRVLAPLGLPGELFASVLTVLAVLTMFGGNLLALLQEDLKRLLAYSSIAHLGYVLVAVVAGGERGAAAATFYMLVYVLMSLGAFGVVVLMSSAHEDETSDLEEYRGLGWSRPWLGGALALMMISLAGVPPTGGFFAKLGVLNAAIRADLVGLAVAVALASGLGLYVYLRVIVTVYLHGRPATGTSATVPASERPVALPTTGVLTVLAVTVAILVIGVYPTPWLRAVATAVAGIVVP